MLSDKRITPLPWGSRGVVVDGVFLKTDREMKKVFYELNEEKL